MTGVSPLNVVVGPFSRWVAVTPSDAAEQWKGSPPDALWVGGAGNIAIEDENAVACVFQGVQAGSLLPVRATRVNNTSTTATLIVALWIN
jgi:hypothetical protein